MTREIRECDFVLFIVTPKAVKAVSLEKVRLLLKCKYQMQDALLVKMVFELFPFLGKVIIRLRIYPIIVILILEMINNTTWPFKI